MPSDSKLLPFRSNIPHLSNYCFNTIDTQFPKRAKDNDGGFIVGGENYGQGSSREHAVITLKTAGVSAVIAPSFARIFYRNAINLGLPLITCKEILEYTNEGDKLEVDLKTGIIKNLTNNREVKGDELPQFVLDMISHGGIKQYYINKVN